jgi:hypothetical protein
LKIKKYTVVCEAIRWKIVNLTLNLLTTTIVAPPSNASKWQMGFNSAFKGLKDVEGSGCGILFDTIPAFVWRG